MLIVKIRVKVMKPTANYQVIQQTKQLPSVHCYYCNFPEVQNFETFQNKKQMEKFTISQQAILETALPKDQLMGSQS